MCEFNVLLQTVIIQLCSVTSVFCKKHLRELSIFPLRAIRYVLNVKKSLGL